MAARSIAGSIQCLLCSVGTSGRGEDGTGEGTSGRGEDGTGAGTSGRGEDGTGAGTSECEEVDTGDDACGSVETGKSMEL